MEAFLHFVWEQRLWSSLSPSGTLPANTIEVLDPGIPNRDAGPDYLEAKILIDGLLWVGSVEIHHRTKAWREHRHDEDPRYNGVILHVVEHDDATAYTQNGRELPTAIMSIAEDLRQRASYLAEHAELLPCAPLDTKLSHELIDYQLDLLARERIRTKANTLLTLYQETKDWSQTIYITLMRYMGFGLNCDAMQQLAQSLPLRCLSKQIDQPEQVEALLLGQASLLEDLPAGTYRTLLEREYMFLATKYSLTPIPRIAWRLARTRPASFPIRRLIQLSLLLRRDSLSYERLNEALSLDQLRSLFSIADQDKAKQTSNEIYRESIKHQPSSAPHTNPPDTMSTSQGMEYWRTLFGTSRRADTLSLGASAIDTLIINIALPVRLAKAELSGRGLAGEDETLLLMKQIRAEQNRHTKIFNRAGIKPRHSADSQALIQLRQNYCLRHKCFYCHWGRFLLSNRYLSQN